MKSLAIKFRLVVNKFSVAMFAAFMVWNWFVFGRGDQLVKMLIAAALLYAICVLSMAVKYNAYDRWTKLKFNKAVEIFTYKVFGK